MKDKFYKIIDWKHSSVYGENVCGLAMYTFLNFYLCVFYFTTQHKDCGYYIGSNKKKIMIFIWVEFRVFFLLLHITRPCSVVSYYISIDVYTTPHNTYLGDQFWYRLNKHLNTNDATRTVVRLCLQIRVVVKNKLI